VSAAGPDDNPFAVLPSDAPADDGPLAGLSGDGDASRPTLVGLFVRSARLVTAHPGTLVGPMLLVAASGILPVIPLLLGLEALSWAWLGATLAFGSLGILPVLHLYRVALGCVLGERPAATALQMGLQWVSAGLSGGLALFALALMLFPAAWALPMVFVMTLATDPTGVMGLVAGTAASVGLAFPAVYVAVRWQYAWLRMVHGHVSAVPALAQSFFLAGRHVRMLVAQAVVLAVGAVLVGGGTCGLGGGFAVAGVCVVQVVTYAALMAGAGGREG
jgi:hypothetical protein